MKGFPSSTFWKNRKVLVTGHTGFKGGWISHWLADLGAEVYGYSLNPPAGPSFFVEANLHERLASSSIGDVRHFDVLSKVMADSEPEIVIHMAAQPLVRESYCSPIETFETNLMGTVNLLQSTLGAPSTKTVLVVTSDKCYENREWLRPYTEEDRLGGHDPYSASKAAAELAVASYRGSFLSEAGIQVATARAGNVIGGGDWSADRLVPDFFRAGESGQPLRIRSKDGVRPWQHVLEPLAGYLTLVEMMHQPGPNFSSPWNFGPSQESHKPVSWVLEFLKAQWQDVDLHFTETDNKHESQLLSLDSSKARTHLGWRPRWDLERALSMTINWQEAWIAGANMSDFTSDQIRHYTKS